jgi:hypothetical protein
VCSQSPDVVPSWSACRRDRLGVQWDSRLGISSNKVLSRLSPHFLPQRPLVIGARPSPRRYDSCRRAGKFPFCTRSSPSLLLTLRSCRTTSDHIRPLPLINSIASSSMSGAHSAFSSLKSDRHPIHLADGKVIYSEGLGSIRFLSDCSYMIAIHNVLFIPFLAVSLFASNKFTREHHDTHSEITEYPKCKWVNRQMGTMEFTMTI